MARLPPPPAAAELAAALRPDHDIVAVPEQSTLVRIYTAAGNHPQDWNTFRRTGPLAHGRFDPHSPAADGSAATGETGVLYLARSARTCIAEVFQATSVVDRLTRDPHLVVLRAARALQLLDLTGLWPTRMGASQEIASGPKSRTQQWARSIRAAYPQLDGLWYPSTMDSGNPVVCLWDPPAASGLPAEPEVRLPLSHPGLDMPLARVCRELNYVTYG